MEPALLEAVMRKLWNESTVLRVLSVESGPAVAKGENYMSTITRITAKVVLGNGRISFRSFILKSMPPDATRKTLVGILSVFKREVNIYIKILREMEVLMDEFKDTEEILWGGLLYHHPYDSILFEDLKTSGFLQSPRQGCLDLEHSDLVMHNIGRFHGMAKILEHRGIFDREDYKGYAFADDKNFISSLIHKGLLTVGKALEESWGAEWAGVAKKLQMPLEELEEKITSVGVVDEARFNVFNHGDLWTANLLFRYDWKRQPISGRFLDFQTSHYNTPSWDLTYFMFASIEPSVRREHYDSLFRTYTDSLLSTLQKFQYPGRHPTHEELVADMERIAIFRLGVSTVLHVAMTADISEVVEYDKILNSKGTEGHSTNLYKSDRFKQRIGPDLRKFYEQGLI